MSVRRLASDDVQPDEFRFTPENDNWFQGELKKYPEGRQRSAIIPALMRAQDQEGWVTRSAIEHIAERLEMPYIRALEVATFYTQFMLAPIGKRAHVQVCGTTPCMLRGSEELIALCKSRIGPTPLVPNAEGTLSWEEVECQGACVNAPMVMIGRDTYEDLTPERLDEIMTAFEEGRGSEITPGPQVDRHLSAPIGGRTTLLDGEELDEAAHAQAPLNGRDHDGADEMVPPSEAGRPDTFSQRTSPAYAPDGAPTVDPEAEEAASSDPDPREEGVGAPRDASVGAGASDDLTATTFGNKNDGIHPPLDQKAPASPYDAGEANEELASKQATSGRGATGGVQKSVPVQSVHRNDDRMPDADIDASLESENSRRDGPDRAVGFAADPDEIAAQREERNPVGADGVAAGDGAVADPKAHGTNEGEAVGTLEQSDTGAATTPGGVADAPARDPRTAPDQARGDDRNTGQNFEAATETSVAPERAGDGAVVEGPEREPQRLDAPQGEADDLELIWGVGPKLGVMLNEMGFYHFWQIAQWGDEELNWVDRRLTGFKGRARRDKWVDQSRKMAEGWRPERGIGDKPE